MPYPYPTPTNITGISGMFQYMNSVTDNTGVPLILLGLYSIITLYMRGRDPSVPITHCMMAAGFFTGIVTIFFVLGKVLSGVYVFYSLLGLIVPVVLTYFISNQ